MNKVSGIKSVDFEIVAYGYGVVNWNGPTTLQSDGRIVDNHTLPKLRGYTNLTGRESEKGYKLKKDPADINFKDTPMYISQNCVRHHIFKDQAFDLHFAETKSQRELLASLTGLIRGYVIPSNQCKRTSPLLITDFIDQLGNGNYEQMGRSGSKEKQTTKSGEDKSNSFFSKTTFGETEYIAYGSISIEQLQFISLDKKFDRAALIIKEGEGDQIASELETFIKSLDPTRSPKAVFHANYVRNGTIFEEGEMGILLDDVAIDILVDTTINLIKELNIKQAKGYMYVDEVKVDYNNSHKMMRIKPNRAPSSTQPTKMEPYAIYFSGK